jgi:hypothetical protein
VAEANTLLLDAIIRTSDHLPQTWPKNPNRISNHLQVYLALGWIGCVVLEWNSVAQIQWSCAFAATEIGRGLLACVKLALLQHLLDGPLIFLPTAFKGGFLAPIVDTWRYEEARRGGLVRHNPNALYGSFS